MARDHPLKALPGYAALAIPMSVRGDGVPARGVGKNWSESRDVLSWSSIVTGPGGAWEARVLILTICKQLVANASCVKTMAKRGDFYVAVAVH
eukprot:3907472-Pyramimonas_sp.AAC.1